MAEYPILPPIDSPWPGYEPVLRHRVSMDNEFKVRLRAAIQHPGADYVVREVFPSYQEDLRDGQGHRLLGTYPRSFVEDLIEKAEREYTLLASIGTLAVARHEYDVTADAEGRIRTLAKVAIIDGWVMDRPDSPDHGKLQGQAHADLSRYRQLSKDPLADIVPGRLDQLVYGIPRPDRHDDSAAAAHVVDLEPLFNEPF